MKQSNIRSRSFADLSFHFIIRLFCLVFAIMILYPLYFIVIASFSDPNYVATGQVLLLPKGITFAGYQRIFEDSRIWMGYRNTLFYSVAGTLINLLVTLPCAYALSRKDFKARNGFMIFFVITMFVNGGLIPTYLTISDLGMENTIWAVLIPFSFNVYNAIIAKTFFESTIPNEMLEAAKMDGCSNTRFFLQIVLPLSQAVVMVLLLYYLVARWNDYFNALVYLRDTTLYPLQLHLRSILLGNQALQQATTGVDAQARVANLIKYGVVIVSSLPLLIFYPLVQKYFTKGVMIGAVKG